MMLNLLFSHVGGGKTKHDETKIWMGSAALENLDSIRDGSALRGIRGSFAVIEKQGNRVILACDVIRSIPLFYGVRENDIYVSDDAAVIAGKVQAALDPVSADDLLLTGCVSGNETVFEGIYQVGPGQVVSIFYETGQIVAGQYFELHYRAEGKKDEQTLIREWDACLKEVFSDMIARLKGRTALVPLSGGCDSRTAAVMLKRLGYENTVCFSYGRKGNSESELSRKVAEGLGFRWLFCEYSGQSWGNFFRSSDYPGYLDFSCKGVGVGCLQPLPAVLELKQRGLVPSDAVVIPGHALDFVAGSHLPPLEEGNVYGRESLIRYIREKHYCLRFDMEKQSAIDRWANALPEVFTAVEWANAQQRWEWIGRQSKYIANDVRAYEYAGYEWELPFWDERVCEFWKKIPLSMLTGRKLQYLYTQKVIDPTAGIIQEYAYHVPETDSAKQKLKQILPFLSGINRFRNVMYQHLHNGNAFYDHLTTAEFLKYYKKYGTVALNGIEAADYITRLKRSGKFDKIS